MAVISTAEGETYTDISRSSSILHLIQNGAPAHFTLPLRARLDNNSPGRCKRGEGGRKRKKWPLRSPDHSARNLFLQGWANVLA